MEGAGTSAGEAYAWAIDNPDKVSCIYGENPAVRSLMSKKPLLDHLAPLARAGVALIHVCGSLDPWLNDQTRVVEKRYKELGGQITVIIKEGEGHYPLGPKDPKAVVDLIVFSARGESTDKAVAEKPLFREFMGLNSHTIQFKPLLLRSGLPVGAATTIRWSGTPAPTRVSRRLFPSRAMAWTGRKVYGDWKAAGYETDVCIMFNDRPARAWKNLSEDARAYGQKFATAFGPSSKLNLVASAEVGNEPGNYDDESYRTLFKSMASGLRAGDPKLKIGTCALATGKSEKYAKSVECIRGLEGLYDFLNIHTYAEVEGYPTWRRSYPEDPNIDYLRRVRQLIEWRDRHAPGKEIRVTEFGWDASTKPAPATGTFSKWIGSTETEQARYLVRSFLLLSKYDVSRAYIFLL